MKLRVKLVELVQLALKCNANSLPQHSLFVCACVCVGIDVCSCFEHPKAHSSFQSGVKVFSNLITEVAKTCKAFKVVHKYLSLHG